VNERIACLAARRAHCSPAHLLHEDAVQAGGVLVVLVLHLKGEHAQQHHKQQHAAGPHVHLLAVVARPEGSSHIGRSVDILAAIGHQLINQASLNTHGPRGSTRQHRTSQPALHAPPDSPPAPHLPLMSSGPMYSGVPMRMVSICAVVISHDLAKPKSQSLRRGGLRPSRIVLSSFRSLLGGGGGGVKQGWWCQVKGG
jgi:hypothetical protein